MNLPDFLNKLKVADGNEAIELIEMLQDGKISGLPISHLDTLDDQITTVDFERRLRVAQEDLPTACAKVIDHHFWDILA